MSSHPGHGVLPAARSSAFALTAGLGGLAWAVLAMGSATSWGRFLEHDALAEAGFAPAVTIGVFVGGWTLMLAAMMLPTTYPLLRHFERMTRPRPEASTLLGAVVAGYLVVWTLVGLAALLGDLALHRAAEAAPVVEEQSWIVAAAVLGAAGAYQLSGLKARCLHRCRDARAVIVTRWRGRAPLAESFTLGASHGAACASCCWALMLVMFAVGAGNLAWMLVLAAAMGAEKTLPGGERLAQPIGAALLLAAAAATVAGTT